jgi:hypothetical protein
VLEFPQRLLTTRSHCAAPWWYGFNLRLQVYILSQPEGRETLFTSGLYRDGEIASVRHPARVRPVTTSPLQVSSRGSALQRQSQSRVQGWYLQQKINDM